MESGESPGTVLFKLPLPRNISLVARLGVRQTDRVMRKQLWDSWRFLGYQKKVFQASPSLVPSDRSKAAVKINILVLLSISIPRISRWVY